MYEHLFNEDFSDFIKALNLAEVRYIVVGGYAVIVHGYARTTGDLDVWVHPDADNYGRLVEAFRQFGLPMFDMTADKFLSPNYNDVFTFGRPPVCIEILTAVKGLEFEQAFARAQWVDITKNLRVRILRLDDLRAAKKAAGRSKDLDDLENLNPES